MRRSFAIPFGSGLIPVEADATRIAPPPASSEPDEAAAILAALRYPTGTPPLSSIVRPGESVAVLVNDITRLARSDLFLPPLLDTLNRAGVPDANIFIVFALGTHRGQTDAERRRIVGESVYGRVRLYDHDSRDEAQLVTLGRTSRGNIVEINRRVWEADRIILTGEILFHKIAGFSGGRKSLVPGVAGHGTITFNHRMLFDPRSGAGVLEGNPCHEDLVEACRFAEPDFLLNVVLGPDGRVLKVVAGHWELAHREGCRAAERLLSTSLETPFELVIASAGGAPLDIDLRQAHKGMENACRALREGGAFIYFAECPDGLGSPSFSEYLHRYSNAGEMEAALREHFAIGAHKAWWVARLAARYDVHMVTRLDSSLAARCGFRHVPPENAQQIIDEEFRRLGTGARAAVLTHAGITVPKMETHQEALV